MSIFASRGFALVIAMSGKLCGIALVGFGLRGILEDDPVESPGDDQGLVIPAVFDRLAGGIHHEGHRAPLHPLVKPLPAHRFVLFDKAYVDFIHLCELAARGVQWVTRAKDNMRFRVRKNLTKGKPNIIKDQLVVLTGKHKGVEVRRVEAWVEIDDEWRRMVFI